MRRASPRRQPESAGNVTNKAPAQAPEESPSAVASPAELREETPTAETPVGAGWGWRLALFLWGASFAFLFLYEILMSLFRGGWR